MTLFRSSPLFLLLLSSTARANMLVGYDFDAASDASEATLVGSNVTASAFTSPMNISFPETVGDNSGVDATSTTLGTPSTLGCVGIGVDDATGSSFENAVTGNDYVAFTITPDPGLTLHLSQITFKATKKATTSVDEYALADFTGKMIGAPASITNLDLTSDYQGVTIDLSSTDYEFLSRATEFRIYAWGRGSSATSNTLAAIDKVALYGSTLPSGDDFFVATNGSDTHPGTQTQPFATIQHAIDQARPGSTISIRGGTYREAIDLAGVSGATDFPITIKAHDDEKVIFDGTHAITSLWTLDEGNIYKTTVAEDVTQLFVDGKLMTLARYPNALAFSNAAWKGAGLKQDVGSSNGTSIDASLAGTGLSYNDCVAIMNFGNHATGARLVSNHTSGRNTFNYSPILEKYKTDDGYFFEGGLNNAERVLLDTTEEWAYDESTNTLYLWTDDGLSPEGREIYAKGTNAYAITGDAFTHDIIIDGIDFFATTFSLKSSDNFTVQNGDFDYYTASKRALGDIEPPETTFIDGNPLDFCVNVNISNCAFRYADGGGLWVDHSENVLIENNLFSNIDYACVDPVDISDSEIFNLTKGTIPIRQSRGAVFRRNTITLAGSAQGVAISLFDSDEGSPCLLEYNFISGCARRESDGAALQIPVQHATHSITRFNWLIGNHQRDFRYDGPSGGPLGNLYRNVALARNGKVIAAEGDGYAAKGDYHEIYHNLGIYQECEIWAPGNVNSTIRNNAAGNFIPHPLGGANSNNFAGQTSAFGLIELLRDPDNYDFRPREGTTILIDQGIPTNCDLNGEIVDVTAGYLGTAPDIGAYEFGATTYWIPGRQEEQASGPVPRLDAEYVRLDSDLMYLIGFGGVSANIYFGTDPGSLTFLTSKNDPENIIELANHLTLNGNTTYYWRVDTVLSDSSIVTGDTWSFKTMIAREYLPWASRSILGGANWSQAENGDLIYDNSGTHHANRSLIHSTGSYQSDGGFKLTIGYTTGSIAKDNAHMFSFGLVSSETDLSTYSGANPFTEQDNVYSLGVSVVANGDGSVQGLNFIDGSGSETAHTILDTAGTNTQFNTLQKYETNDSTIVEINISPGGLWSYSIDGIEEASGTFAALGLPDFDLSKSYQVAVYGRDDAGGSKKIQHLSLECDTTPAQNYSSWIVSYGLSGPDALTDSDSIDGDGYSNLLEFALGMNPTISDPRSKESTYLQSEGADSLFVYQYQRRSDCEALGLTYLLNVTSDLETVLTTPPYDETVGDSTNGFETVTTRFLIDDPTKFIQLMVEIDSP